MKEQDNIRSFIQDNLEDFNTETPSDKVWKGIQSPVKKSYFKQYLGIAASIIVLATAGFYTILQNAESPEEIIEVVDNTEYHLPEEVKDVEVFYATQVNQKIAQLQNYEESEELLDEVADLKTEFEELKADMGIGVNRERVLEAMIDNYRTRLIILEDLLEELENEENIKIPEDEKNI